ncbi:MAG TPA: tetratricopeptide repeat protein [Vicinamibacteria bacterium]|jgi:tetratricopeptide (TPR) repeat protein|nr:tetratricopeptide repeat protein [Vicinamibacteria bacterium]
MNKIRALCAVAVVTLVLPAVYADTPAGRRFEWSTKSPEAKKLLSELQLRIENFQGGAETIELAKKLVAADPNFAIGQYYFSAVTPGPEAEKEYEKSRVLAKNASEGERRFIEAMSYVRTNQGLDFKKSIEPLEALATDYPNERLIQVILGQLYAGDNKGAKALAAFEKCQKIGPKTARVEAFLAGDDLLKGRYVKARTTYESVEKSLPKGSVPFAIRFGVTFSHLYEGNVDAALNSLRTYLAEYKSGGLDQQFPEVFIWNAMARINLENDRLDEAMKDYEKGYESVPGSKLPEDQKQTWLGRLRHGKARVLARQGKHQEAWAEAEAVRSMIEAGGEPAKQYWPAYHYLAGYVKLQAGEYAQAVEHLKQAEPENPFHTLLLARAYEKLGQKEDAKKAYEKIVASEWVGIERPLSYPEAKKKLQSL